MPDLTQEGLAARGVPELLPCPLCGVEPEYSPPSEVSDLPFIACPTVSMTPEGFDEKCGLTSQSVSHWNKRAALIREAVRWGFISAAPGEWRVSDIQRVTEAIEAALRKDEEPK